MSHRDSKRWLQQHVADEYVKKAQHAGYPSRAAYKLLELQHKYDLIHPGALVVDLGAAPGGWSLVAKELVGDKGQVFAVDILEIEPIAGIEIIQGDFNEQAVLDKLISTISHYARDGKVDLVISDMAPNITGHKSIDQPRSLQLVELAIDFAQKMLKPGGSFLAKVFQGAGVDNMIKTLRQSFKTVKLRKPKASRARSSEIYLLATNFLGYNENSI